MSRGRAAPWVDWPISPGGRWGVFDGARRGGGGAAAAIAARCFAAEQGATPRSLAPRSRPTPHPFSAMPTRNATLQGAALRIRGGFGRATPHPSLLPEARLVGPTNRCQCRAHLGERGGRRAEGGVGLGRDEHWRDLRSGSM